MNTKTRKPTQTPPLLTEEEILKMSEDDYMNPAQLAFFKARLEKMEQDLSKIPADAKKAMAYSHDHLIPDMEKARELADRLEELTPAERWPFPVYSDLLFSV